MINTIRCIVELKQAKSDRTTQDILRDNEESLQSTIAIVGFGIGSSGVGATTSIYIIHQEPETRISFNPFVSNKLHPVTLSLLFSLGCGVVGAMIAGGFSYVIHHRDAINQWIIKQIPSDN
jgi:hypothetical protein